MQRDNLNAWIIREQGVLSLSHFQSIVGPSSFGQLCERERQKKREKEREKRKRKREKRERERKRENRETERDRETERQRDRERQREDRDSEGGREGGGGGEDAVAGPNSTAVQIHALALCDPPGRWAPECRLAAAASPTRTRACRGPPACAPLSHLQIVLPAAVLPRRATESESTLYSALPFAARF